MVSETNGQVGQELETFLPQDGSNLKDGLQAKYKITPHETEAGTQGDFDPFKERKLDHPTTNGETLTHLLKASLGTGILAMPVAFKYSGLIVGIFATIFVALICTHCSYVLVKCAHVLYRRKRVTAMTFAEVAEIAFSNGPAWGRKFSTASKFIILSSIFVTYFGTCSVYSVIVARNFKKVIDYNLEDDIDIKIYIAVLLVPLILLCWVPNLKYLAPVSMCANVFMGLGLGITFYYLVTDMPSPTTRSYAAPLSTLPAFFSITIFAIEAIGVVMPLENQMKTPQSFVGLCGVLNQGMSGVTLIYILLGFLGYVKYGDLTEDSITLNLPDKDIPAQAVQILIGLAVYCTFGLQFYVCLEIAWNGIKDHFKTRPLIVNYVLRTVLVTAAIVLAIAVPTIGPFIGLIGAFCFSILGLLAPVFIETVTFWDQGFGPGNWVIWKNVFICIFGLFALVFGSKSAISEIIDVYADKPTNQTIIETASSIVNQTVAAIIGNTTEASIFVNTTAAP